MTYLVTLVAVAMGAFTLYGPDMPAMPKVKGIWTWLTLALATLYFVAGRLV